MSFILFTMVHLQVFIHADLYCTIIRYSTNKSHLNLIYTFNSLRVSEHGAVCRFLPHFKQLHVWLNKSMHSTQPLHSLPSKQSVSPCGNNYPTVPASRRHSSNFLYICSYKHILTSKMQISNPILLMLSKVMGKSDVRLSGIMQSDSRVVVIIPYCRCEKLLLYFSHKAPIKVSMFHFIT